MKKLFTFSEGYFFDISTFAIIFLLIGRLTTFNFNNDINSPHLDKQDYEICIRREVGKKFIRYKQLNKLIQIKII